MKKTLGIIGGMGPMATADLFRKIIEETVAERDQDHIHLLIDNNTDIPDRTAALLDGAESPLPEMVKSAKWLEQAGAEGLLMPCNTAHGFYEALRVSVSVPVLNMIALTGEALTRRGVTCAGLLATTGTVCTGVYQKYIGDIRLLTPDEAGQAAVMDMIYGGVKAGKQTYSAAAVQRVAERLLAKGAQCLILGCTELPLAMEWYNLRFPAVDPTLELARGAVLFAGGQLKNPE